MFAAAAGRFSVATAAAASAAAFNEGQTQQTQISRRSIPPPTPLQPVPS